MRPCQAVRLASGPLREGGSDAAEKVGPSSHPLTWRTSGNWTWNSMEIELVHADS